MVSVDVIEREISELEARETTYAVCERLSWLYVVRDHLLAKATPPQPRTVATGGGSEFLETIEGRDLEGVLAVIDDHLEALRTVQPRAYAGVMRRLREVPSH